MIERIIIVVGLAVLSLIAYRLFNRYHLRRVAAAVPSDPILSDWKPGVPAVIYFTTPGCIPCQTQQQPALKRLTAEMGAAVQVIKVDAAEDPDAAERWGVFTAPTTFILDPQGQPCGVNHGVADTPKLRRQIEAIAG